MPALPQQTALSSISTRRKPGILPSRRRGAAGDALRVHEMARLLIRRRSRRSQRAGGPSSIASSTSVTSRTRCEKRTARVAHSLIVGKELAVLFERAAAAGGIDDVDVGAAAFERGDVALGELAREIDIAGVHGDRAATALVGGDDDGQAGALQHAHRRLVDVRERNGMMQPACKKATPLRLRRVDRWSARNEETRPESAVRAWRRAPQAEEPAKRDQPRALREAHDAARRPRISSALPKSVRSRSGARVAPGGLAGCAARARSALRAVSTSLPYCTPEGQTASQARQSRHSHICSTNPALKHVEPPFADRFDETNPAARAGGFCHSLEIRRARRQAEAAADARIVNDATGLIGSAETGRARARSSAYVPSPPVSAQLSSEQNARINLEVA